MGPTSNKHSAKNNPMACLYTPWACQQHAGSTCTHPAGSIAAVPGQACAALPATPTCHSQQQVKAAELHNNRCNLSSAAAGGAGCHTTSPPPVSCTRLQSLTITHTQQHCTVNVQLPAQARHSCAPVHTGTCDNLDFVCRCQASCKHGAPAHGMYECPGARLIVTQAAPTAALCSCHV
jgi:hypothetical protein